LGGGRKNRYTVQKILSGDKAEREGEIRTLYM